MGQGGSAQRSLGKAQGENLRLPRAFSSTDELSEPELGVLGELLVLPKLCCLLRARMGSVLRAPSWSGEQEFQRNPR